MSEMDYRGLAALDAVVGQGGFDKAADKLAITQSAVSQRIRILENSSGELLIVRSQPPQATDAGQRLIAHYRQVKLLEAALQRRAGPQDDVPEIAIAANADSAATWLQEAVAPLMRSGDCLLNIRLDDQDHTLSQLREGRVFACVTAESSRVPGTTATPLGTMRYLCVASPRFARRWFPDGFTADAVRQAPVLLFDLKDATMERYVAQRLGRIKRLPHHTLSSSDGIVRFIEAGLGYAMIPVLQCESALKRRRLVDLTPGDGLDVALIWHAWDIQTPLTRRLSEQVIATARKWLRQDAPPPRR